MDEEKVISIEKHIPKLKEARKKKSNRRFIFYLIIFLSLLFILVYLQTPLSKVKTIEIKGNHFLTEADILKDNKLSVGQSMWLVDKEKVKRSIQASPYIKKVEVSRVFPRTILVEVVERDIVGYIQNEKNLFIPVLKNGEIQKEDAMQQPTNRIIFHDFKEEKYLERLIEELEHVPEDIVGLISEITWKPTDKNKYQIELYMNDGYKVIATIRDFQSKIVLYPSIVAQLDDKEQGVIHLGVGAYFEKAKTKKK